RPLQGDPVFQPLGVDLHPHAGGVGAQVPGIELHHRSIVSLGFPRSKHGSSAPSPGTDERRSNIAGNRRRETQAMSWKTVTAGAAGLAGLAALALFTGAAAPAKPPTAARCAGDNGGI